MTTSASDVVVDTSAWIEYFRSGEGRASEALDVLLDEERALLCGVVEAEILRGLRPEEQGRISDLFRALPYLEAERRDWVKAGERLGELRQRGINIPLTDALIGALCLRHDAALLTLDRHLDHLPDVVQLIGEDYRT